MFSRKVALTIAVLAVTMAAPVSAASPADWLPFTERIVTASERMGADPLSGDPAGEMAWAFDNPPDTCYAVTWGRWLLESMRIFDAAAAANDVAGLGTDLFMARMDDMTGSLDASTAACLAAL